MTKTRGFWVELGFLAILAVLTSHVVWAGPRDGQWKKVAEAVKQDLPKTAIEELEPIIAGAIKDKAYGEAGKAIALRVECQSSIEGRKPETRIILMQAEADRAPEEMKPVLEAILANWYWEYFVDNRYRLMERTTTAAQPSEDFRTWDLPRILSEVDKRFAQALAHDKTLKTTPVSSYSDLFEGPPPDQWRRAPDSYRPTVFDLIAFMALDFYAAGEQAGAKAEDEFELSADSPIFGTVDQFLEWKPAAAETDSPTVKAIRLYQELLAFHRSDPDKAAFIDADLWRLRFGYNKASGEEKNARYKEALSRLVAEWSGHEISARALYQWANILYEEGDLAAAYDLAKRGIEMFPKSSGGEMCSRLVKDIQDKSAVITTEGVWNEPMPAIRVTYRNVSKIFFRAVSYSFDKIIETPLDPAGDLHRYISSLDDSGQLAAHIALAWAVDLPPTLDFKARIENLSAPRGLKPGLYILEASLDPSFSYSDESFANSTLVWVSDLALVMRTGAAKGVTEGFVLNAVSGEPLSGAVVQAWSYNSGSRRLEQIGITRSDANGLFRFNQNDNSCIFLAEHKGQRLATSLVYLTGEAQSAEEPQTQTVFFTDRSLYRPGQAIQYKGICFRADRQENNYKTLAGQVLTVLFLDPNHKEIARQQVKANDYGSFSGSFIAPRDRLTGSMSIVVRKGPPGRTWFNVEEYKRPKFQVELTVPKQEIRLNGEVSISGKALAYTGAAVGDARLKYRVLREVRMPRWCWWGPTNLFPRGEQSQAIAHGTTVTQSDGSFTVKFMARPDLSVSEKDAPTFDFTVHADVTDANGETRSAQQSVHVGFTALQAELTAEEWQTSDKPVDITVDCRTLDGGGLSAAGTVKVYALKQPLKVERPELELGYERLFTGLSLDSIYAWREKVDLSDPRSWEPAQVVDEQGFKTDAMGRTKLSVPLNAGIYRAILDTKDRFGKVVTARLSIVVVDPKKKHLAVKIANYFSARKWSLEPGESLFALWGTGYAKGRAFVEIEHQGKTLQSFWTAANRTQHVIRQTISEDMRGGFTLRATYVRENRAYFNERTVEVPWSNKRLDVKWEHFTSKLDPGRKATWSLVVTGHDGKNSAVEMAAALYDAALDAFLPHQWIKSFNVFRREFSMVQARFENPVQRFGPSLYEYDARHKYLDLIYRDILFGTLPYRYYFASPPLVYMAIEEPERSTIGPKKSVKVAAEEDVSERVQTPKPDLAKVSVRKNLKETAFFFPHLLADADGVVKIEFSMPEALTEWKFLGFAHDQALRSGFITDKAITVKDLMVEPNPPRFVREGDTIEFTVKVTNQADRRQTGQVKVSFADAATLKSVDAELGNNLTAQAFDIPPKESRTFGWPVTVPDGMGFLVYKAVGASDSLSDGEEGYLPVLSRRILVSESLPLPVRGKQTRQFEFAKLIRSGESATLRHQALTLQMVSQPAWYAVMSLPYLMEFPYECTEQTFNRLYANALARHIANSDPKIRRIFDLWENTPALDSPLEKNQDLKAMMIEETPWVRQAQAESLARKNVGILFDDNRLGEEIGRGLRKLAEQQLSDGAWPWFPGGSPNDFITLYITTGFGRLRHLGLDVDDTCAIKSLGRLDNWINNVYRMILKISNKEDNHLSSIIALYLYGRSFFLKQKPLEGPPAEAVDYFLDQARKYWPNSLSRQSQAHLALALQRFGDHDTAAAIMKSIKERSIVSAELGMYWSDLELSWWWFRAPIETQAMMIEAFDEIMNDAQAVEDCKVWLLKQKQMQAWKTTKATADAVYALILRGTGMLASDALTEVTLAGEVVRPENVEAGTGFFERHFSRDEIRPNMGFVTVKKIDEGVSWGSLHWQYLEDMSKVTPYSDTPLKLKKTLFVKETTVKGNVLQPISEPLAVGDELVVRIELRADRDMEYVHLKDQRGSGTEPANVLSGYRYQDGLVYYESTRDTASHFFIDYLPKGVYVFEYSTRVQLKGRYQSGVASIQCMYAPEFNSHSESFGLEVNTLHLHDD